MLDGMGEESSELCMRMEVGILVDIRETIVTSSVKAPAGQPTR